MKSIIVILITLVSVGVFAQGKSAAPAKDDKPAVELAININFEDPCLVADFLR